MKHLQTLTLILTTLLFIGVSACGTARRGEPLQGPMNITNSAVAQGRVVFEEYCQPCHPGGEAGLGPALNDKPLPGFLIKTQVRVGLGVMPSFDKHHISKEELDNVVKYMKALRRHG